MSTERHLLVTFDYELFLGKKSGSVKKCLTEPTQIVLDCLKQFPIKAVFFIDTLYLYRLSEAAIKYEQAKIDFLTILAQLKQIISQGHYVFHHIHPHWLDAIYLADENQWDCSNKQRFALSNLTDSELDMVFEASEKILREVYELSFPSVMGYRAGGLYIQPFEKFLPYFLKYKIGFDFSVLKDHSSVQDSFGFNFSNPPTQNVYRFESDVLVNEAVGSFTEVAINYCEYGNAVKVASAVWNRTYGKLFGDNRIIGDGIASGNKVGPSKPRKNSRIQKFRETYSVELMNYVKAKKYTHDLKRKGYMHIISHPKLFSHDSLNAFNFFLKDVFVNYKIETDFLKINNSG